MGCPWETLAQSPSSFCETPLCAWIREPGNTWSNAGFLIVAAMIFRSTSSPARAHLRPLAYITLMTGVGSIAFHATDTSAGAALDYAGMFLGGAFMLLVCFLRWTNASRGVTWAFFGALAAAGAVAFALDERAARVVYAGEGLLCVLSEGALFLTPRRAREYRWFCIAYAGFVPAMLLWTLDMSRRLCDPNNHILSGHAAWHLLTAAAYYASFRYYQQFEVLRILLRSD